MLKSAKVSAIQKIVLHCSVECNIQKSGELSVSRMFDAWLLAIDEQFLNNPEFDKGKIFIPTVSFICYLAKTIEPDKNWRKPNFRELPVIINETMIPVTDFQNNLDSLIKNGWFKGNAEEFYLAFEKLHPFIDGNGRVGNILFNLLNGTIYNPVQPPEFK